MSTPASQRPRTFPPWLRRRWPVPSENAVVRNTLDALTLNTVCAGAQCPNQGECWQRGTATFMILGRVCTRKCPFCGVPSGTPETPDPEEPARIAEAVRRLGLRHVVVTTVTRDDLPDGGAAQLVAVTEQVRSRCPDATIELLTSDFGGAADAVQRVAAANPDVFAHNIETVARLHPLLRDPRACYERSLSVLELARETLKPSCHVKSGFMVGCGETDPEIQDTLRDLHNAGCDAVTIGQYLKPAGGHVDVQSFVPPEQFDRYEQMARDTGFAFVMAGPFVRSSYHAEELTEEQRAG